MCLKKIWINHEKKLMSFKSFEGAELYAKNDVVFWNYIIHLANEGYRIM